MIENSTPVEQVHYDHKTDVDKHFFGSFLNLADDNWEGVKKAYFERFKETFENKFDIEHFKSLTYQDYQDRVDFLKRHLPVVYYLDIKPKEEEKQNKEETKEEIEERRTHFVTSFTLLYKGIKSLRNFYTHFYHKPLVLEDDFYTLLDDILLRVISDVKKLKKKDDKTKQILKSSLEKEFNILIELKKESLEKKDLKEKSLELKKEGKKFKRSFEEFEEEDITNAVFNDAFRHLIYVDKTSEKEKISKYYQSKPNNDVTENKISLSQSGLLFLLGMFLNRKDNEDLRAKNKGYKATVIKDPEKETDYKNNSLKYMATHWVFGFLSFKGVKHRLQTQFTKETLLLQIADELSKVPDVVCQTFSEEQRESFIKDINEYVKEGEKNVSRREDSMVVHPVICKRYEDKFNYFALRYLDEFADFPTLRFQLHLGNYVHDQREKTIKGTVFKTERIIKERIKTFAKLSETTNVKNDFFNGDKDTKGWELFPNPSYNIINNNIPIYFIEGKDKELSGNKFIGTLRDKIEEYKKANRATEYKERKKDKESKSAILSQIKPLKPTFISEAPHALLSLNELPALLYSLLVGGKTGKDIELLLLNKLKQRFELIDGYDGKEELSNAQIARSLKKSTEEAYTDLPKLIRALEKEIVLCKEKLQLIKDNKEELKDKSSKRKYVFTTKELGQEATWLAYDLKRFMPEAVREGWKGYQHSFLQQSLAFYNHAPQEAFEYLNSHWDLNKSANHYNKWIPKAFRETRFDELLNIYLEERLKFFTELDKNLKSFEKNNKLLRKFIKQQDIWRFFNKKEYTISAREQLKQRLLVKLLVFPRGIFDDKPTYIRGKELAENLELYADWYTYAHRYNTYQSFYQQEKNYKELYKLYLEKRTKQYAHREDKEQKSNKYELTKEEQRALFENKYEKYIRKVQTEDVFLQLIVKDILHKLLGCEEEISLESFYFEGGKWVITTKGEDVKIRSVWDFQINYKTSNKETASIEERDIRLKDIGKIKRLVNEAKTKSILSYDTDRVWTLKELEDKLYLLPNSYETIRREKLLKNIQEFEKAILEAEGFDGVNHPKEFESKEYNLAYWGLLTPNIGIEYRPKSSYGFLLNGAYAPWKWKDSDRRHQLWQINPQIRYYTGEFKDSYLEIEAQGGQYNIKWDEDGKQGDFYGGGIILGHQFYAGKQFIVDLGFGLGYMRLNKQEKYQRINGVDTRSKTKSHNYWGPTSFSMTVVYILGT